jgi:hypothetical protein
MKYKIAYNREPWYEEIECATVATIQGAVEFWDAAGTTVLIVSTGAFWKIELIEEEPEPSNIAYQAGDLTVTIDPPLDYVHAEVDPNTGERLKSGESEWGDR